ncbi:hypothetical protein EDB87DRAFT_1826284 [Lactarius vividus]|nr:hypothetical protein EDB87DRAFT_1826284 [Lactarius vividus]
MERQNHAFSVGYENGVLRLHKAPPVSPGRARIREEASPVDWFEFLNAGCDVDDCTRYASFERDKIDEAILPDITGGTLRTLGLREGDIIRVAKVIEVHRSKPLAKAASSEVSLLGGDEAGGPARATSSPGPLNLFTGPGGQLKNARRGRPTPSKTSSTAPGAVDLTAISTASEQIARTMTPLPRLRRYPPSRLDSAAASGFDDDAWTNRPSSTKPVRRRRLCRLCPLPGLFASAPAPTPLQSPRAPSAPKTQLAPSSASTDGGLAKTGADIFDRLACVEIPAAAAPKFAPPAPSPGIASPPAMAAMSGYNPGLGVSHAPPLGPHPALWLLGYFRSRRFRAHAPCDLTVVPGNRTHRIAIWGGPAGWRAAGAAPPWVIPEWVVRSATASSVLSSSSAMWLLTHSFFQPAEPTGFNPGFGLLRQRARGLLLLGAVFKSTVPDESDEERRELERMVAEAAEPKKKQAPPSATAQAGEKSAHDMRHGQANGQTSPTPDAKSPF